jgi:hypothetical protein
MSKGAARVECEGLVEGGQRVLEPPQGAKRDPSAVIYAGIIGVECKGPIVGGQRGLELAASSSAAA